MIRVRPRQHGFSLLEILVALAIAALALGMLYRVSGNNASQAGALDQRTRAAVLAQSLLAVNQTVPVTGINATGTAADFTWQVHSSPYPTPASQQSPQAPRLYELAIRVRWSDGARTRSFALTTLRPERREEGAR